MSKSAVVMVLVFVLALFSSFTTLYALEDQFEIHLTVTASTDTTPPSTPTALVATAVSSSQIDLSWTASTDNVAVTGYRIYRAMVFITTVATTNYSDIGLSPSTPYDYTVSAIDAALNESVHSATSTATTFATPTSGGSGTPSQTNGPVIYNLAVVPSQNGAVITWQTTQPTIGTLSWGLTQNHELGTDGQVIYATSHSVTLSTLLSGTNYFFSINAQNGYGRSTNLLNQSFQTLPFVQQFPNPTNFVASPRTNDILLSWKNPNEANFEEVRVVRGNGFYPSDPNDGQVIYEGSGEQVPDTEAEVGKTYYYAVFAKYASGQYSSGVVTKGRIPVPGEIKQPEQGIFESLPKAPSIDPKIEALTFLDFDFVQNGKKISTLNSGESVGIDGNANLTVSLDYSKVPEILKSMVVTLSYPDDATRTFSFLLRVNEEKTAYTATISPLGKSGKYGVNISIVDYKNRGLKKVVGDLVASVATAYRREGSSVLVLRQIFFNSLLLLIILFVLYEAFRAVFKRKKKKFFAGKDSDEDLY